MVMVSPSLNGTIDITPFLPDQSINVAIVLFDNYRI
jgi:hypothetical protein